MLKLNRYNFCKLMHLMEEFQKKDPNGQDCFVCNYFAKTETTGVKMMSEIAGEEFTILLMTMAHYYQMTKGENVIEEAITRERGQAFKLRSTHECIKFKYLKEILDTLYDEGIIQIKK